MPGVATESHPLQSGGYACSQFYGTGAGLHSRPSLLHVYTTIGPNISSSSSSSSSSSGSTSNNNSSSSSSSSDGGIDVTDNKTSESLQICDLKPIYTMADIYHREDERLKTFSNWPLEWLDKRQLAQTGMFYTNESDKTKCYFCEVEIGRWVREDQPVSEHLRWSPNCPLLRRRTTNNVPISAEALDRILPPPSYDICGMNDEIEVRPQAYAEGTIPAARMMAAAMPPASPAASSSSGGCGGSAAYFPEYPEYAIESARLRSFGEWPRNMKQKPAELAEAGFFYTGVGDRVKCFSCGGGLKDWDDTDEPWEQHALWMNKCRFLKLIKGQSYIDAVLAKQKAKAEKMETGADDVGAQQEGQDDVESEEERTRQNHSSSAETLNGCASPEAARICALAAQTATSDAKKPNSSIPEEKLCKICYAGEYNTAFLPCGHVVACAKCASSVTKCPLCRKAFTDVMRVYFS